MLTYMFENKRILNLHEQKFADIAVFQANTTVFQANTIVFQSNTNFSLKYLETQVGQLALAMQTRSIYSFLSDTKKNPKDYMTIILRDGKELRGSKEDENK